MSASQQPNDQGRNEEPKPESRGITGPLKDNPAVAWAAFISFLGFAASLAWAENHHTTGIWSYIAGMVCCLLVVYLYGPFRKKRKDATAPLQDRNAHLLPAPPFTLSDHQPPPQTAINNQQPADVQSGDEEIRRRLQQTEAETQRTQERAQELKASNNQLKDEIDEAAKYKTTELPHIDLIEEAETKPMPEQENTKTKSTETPNREKVRPPVPFPSGSGNLWMEYDQDVFHNIIWCWHYKPEIAQIPRDIRPYCIECQALIPLQHHAFKDGAGNPVFSLDCGYHSVQLCEMGNLYEFNEKIRELIKQKLKDGSWVEVVNKRRIANGLAPLSPDVHVSHGSKASVLDGTKLLILELIARAGGSYEYDLLLDILEDAPTESGDGPIDNFVLMELLKELEKDWKYVKVNKPYSDLVPVTCELTDKGSAFVREMRKSPARNTSKAKLSEIQEQILLVLWCQRELGSSCALHIIEDYIGYLRHMEGKPRLDKAMIEHHIKRLVKGEYIVCEQGIYVHYPYSLAEKGSDYIIGNHLHENDWYYFLRNHSN